MGGWAVAQSNTWHNHYNRAFEKEGLYQASRILQTMLYHY